MHPRMSQLNVIHEVGDSQDESSSSDDDTVPPSESPQGGEASNDTDNPVFTRKTLG